MQGKPPSSDTGRVGAVGQIHLICIIFERNDNTLISMGRKLGESAKHEGIAI